MDAISFYLNFFIPIVLKILLIHFIIYHQVLEHVRAGGEIDDSSIVIEHTLVRDIVRYRRPENNFNIKIRY